MRLHQSRTLSAAIAEMLTDAGVAAAVGRQPDGTGWQTAPSTSSFVPYVALYPMTGGRLDGAIGDGQEDAAARYQLTCVGATPEQAEWVADVARTVMLGTPPVVDGRLVTLVTSDDLSGVVRDDDAQPPIWYVAERYVLLTTPA